MGIFGQHICATTRISYICWAFDLNSVSFLQLSDTPEIIGNWYKCSDYVWPCLCRAAHQVLLKERLSSTSRSRRLLVRVPINLPLLCPGWYLLEHEIKWRCKHKPIKVCTCQCYTSGIGDGIVTYSRLNFDKIKCSNGIFWCFNAIFYHLEASGT